MYRRLAKELFQKKIFIIAGLFVIAVILIGSSISGLAKAKKSKAAPYKYYTSITVEKGDTLWSIASEHMTPEYGRIEEYIMEIRNLNHISDDGIYAGEYLAIPKYDEM